MKYILALVTKEKQCEYLVEKLFQYFESATTERQWCDLAYCLSLLNYSDKGLKKILDNVKFFASKLYLADVYEAFCSIISDASKNPQKDKTLVNELNTIIKEYRDQCCKDKSVCLPIKKQCTQSTKKRVIRKKYLPSDSEEEEFERRSQRKRKKVYDKKDSNNEETDNESLLSDASSEKGIPERSRSGENKENYTTDDSNSGL